MEVATQTNNYQMLNAYKQNSDGPVTLPVEPKEPTYSLGDIYDASQGNLISDREGNISLTPQGEVNLGNAIDDKKTQVEQEEQAKKDAFRSSVVDYVGMQSKKSQAEIYLSVATDSDMDLGGAKDTAQVLESLRDIQKQNNLVQAYAIYKENQNPLEINI